MVSILEKYLPSWVHKQLIGNWDDAGFKKYFKNTGWIFFARIFTFFVSFLTIAIVARYLGPENLGKLSYAQSFIAIFSIFASLGIDQIVFRELIANPKEEGQILGTAILAKFLFGLLTLIVTVSISFFINQDIVLTWLIGIISLSFIFQPLGTVSHIFNAKVQSKYPSLVSIGVSIIIPIFKLLVIYFDRGILFFAVVLTLEALIYSCVNYLIYLKLRKPPYSSWSFSYLIFRKLFSASWPLMLAGASGYIYARIDQIMIQHFINSTSVGLYEAAVRITELLGLVPSLIIGSLFPALINAKKSSLHEYKKRLRLLTLFCLTISSILVIGLWIFSPLIVQIIFGEKFEESASILRVYAWSGIGTIATALIYNYLIAEDKSRTYFIYTISGAIINVLLNIYLIPIYGVYGAAYATLFTLFSIVILFLLSLYRK